MTWCLVSNTGVLHVLPLAMTFVGRENCEINILSRSVDKRHSVINYDRFDNAYYIKDMETLNGTFVNETRIPDQTYITLQRGDSIRFGYDPVTYRFDKVNPSNIRQFKGEGDIKKLAMDSLKDEVERVEVDEGNKTWDDVEEEGYLNKGRDTGTPQHEDQTSPVERKMAAYGRTTPLKQESSTSSQPSALYGQPAWWGQDEDVQGEEETCSQDREESGQSEARRRSGTYTAYDKDITTVQANYKQIERPTKLPIADAAERDIPIHMYTRPSTDLNPTTPVKRVPTPEHTEVTLMSASEKHVGFTIEFNAKEDAPKMSMNESLSEFVPPTVKSKMEGSSKMVEEMKAERIYKKGVTDEPETNQSAGMSPSAVQKLNIMWSTGSGKKMAKPTDGRLASTPELARGESSKQLKMRPNSAAWQPTSSKSGPLKSQSSLGHHKPEESNDHNGDNVSESGTYTIESESQSKEVLEARSRIDEVFGVGMSTEAKQGSDEDTDKDIGIDEIQEEVVTMEMTGVQEIDVNKYLDQQFGKSSESQSSKSSEKYKPLQPKPPAGAATGPAWVRQWAVLASKDTSPRDPNRSPQSDASLSPRNQTASTDETNRSPRQNSQAPTAPPRRSGKRLLPTTPPERSDKQPSHPTHSEDSSKQNGLHIRQSPSSAFYSPRNRDESIHQEQTSTKEILSPRNESNPTVYVTKDASGVASPLSPSEDADFQTEVSMDTEILLKDTETFVKSLEMRMRDRKRSTPSPELSESYDISHRSFDGDIDTDLDTASCVSLVGTAGSAHPLRPNQASLPPSGFQGNRSLHDTNTEAKNTSRKTPDPKTKKSSIWNRLSQPTKHKRTEKNPQGQSKDSASDCLSDSMDSVAFRRNTGVTSSLPSGRVTGRKTPKESRESDSKETSPKIIRKIKANLSKPRQTRSTMLRKSRFDGKESPSFDQSELSPSSSISDMSSSRNSSMFRRSSNQRESMGRSQDSKDQHSRSKTASARIDTGRSRTNSRSSEQTPRSEVSLGGQIVQQARSQSLRERKINAGESSARIMGKVQVQSSKTTSSTSRRTSQSSVESGYTKKVPTGTWRRYKEPSTETDPVDAYIRSVANRQVSVSSADESSIKSAPAYNYHKPGSTGGSSSQYRPAMSMQHLAGGTHHRRTSQESLRNGNDEIAQASNSLAESLQRLAKGDSSLGMAMENVPKDERMMDEILGEDTVGVGVKEVQTEQPHSHKQPLQRSTSVGYNSQGISVQSPVLAQPGSPPVSLKHKQWSKPESFDMLVMSSINHLSVKLKDNTDQIAYKLKKLQSPQATDEELRDALKESDSPLLKTHNKEIASILKNMRQLEKRLSEINTMIDPRDEITLPEQLTPAAQIRRKYINDYGASTSHVGTTSILAGKQKGQGGGSSTGPNDTPRSSRSDESEYYV